MREAYYRHVYVLVTLLEGPRFGEIDVDHEPFVDSLMADHPVPARR